jgi:ZIP family zinc transporter
MYAPQILLITLFAGMCTGLGGLVAFLYKRVQDHLPWFLGCAAGIMFGLIIFSLVPEGLDHSYSFGIVGLIIGLASLLGLDVLLPHIHTRIRSKTLLRLGILVSIGIALHDLPEGLAIGVGYISTKELGFTLALGIALHNVPEGAVVTGTLLIGNVSKLKAIIISFACGLPSFFGALVGLLFGKLGIIYLAIGLGFAAGAMLYTTVDEIIPQAYKAGKEHVVAAYLVLGVIIGALISLIHTV